MKPMIWAGIIAVVALARCSISVGIISAFDFGWWGGAVDGRRGKALSRADLARLSSEVSHRRMAECLASNQVLHLDHKLRVTPLYILHS
jgi:hypothetical protein